MNRLLPSRRLVVVLLVGLVLAACGPSERGGEPATPEPTAESPPAPTPIGIRLKWLVQVHSAGEIVAAEKGFCDEQGLKCEVRPGGPDFDSIKLVASGQDDYGVTSADRLILARSKGIPVVAIGVLFQESPVCFFARAGTGFSSPSDFLGRKIGVKFGTNAETEYAVLLKRAGIERSKVVEVPVKFDLGPFLTEQVDVWPGLESNEPLAVAAKGVEVEVLRSRDHGIETYSNVYFTTEDRVRENPEEVRRFLAAVGAGWGFVRREPDAAVDLVLAANPQLARDHERKALDLTLPIIFPDDSTDFGDMTAQGWFSTQSVLLDGGLLEAPIELDEAWLAAPGSGRDRAPGSGD